jgi:hypothetical protein
MFVSAKFIKDPLTGATDKLIEAIDDYDPPLVWSVPGMDCDVGDWVDFLARGGTVEPYVEPQTQPAGG